MIPIKIQIKNFLSYGAELQTIDFGNYHLICLSGKNGHGKSALLDAMTWAIWGQARKAGATAKADSGLIRLGQKQMLVIFDFVFNFQHYRIRREVLISQAKTTAVLEFGMIQDDGVITLTDKTIKATQDAIVRLIGLDFDAFINSAFLRQGGSNEFSKKSSKERKEILAAILGLNHYEQLKDLAAEKVRYYENILLNQEQLTKHLDNELGNLQLQLSVSAKIDYEKDLLAQQEKVLRAELAEFEQYEKNITLQLRQYDSYQKTKEMLQSSFALIVSQLQGLKNSFQTTQIEIVSCQFIPNFESLEKEYFLQEKISQNQNNLEHDKYLLVEKKNKILNNFERDKEILNNNIENQKKLLSNKLDILFKQRQDLGPVIKIVDYFQEITNCKNQITRLQQKISAWSEQLKNLTNQIAEIARQSDLLSLNDQCLVCEQTLTGQYKDLLHNKIQRKYNFINLRVVRLNLWLIKSKNLCSKLSADLDLWQNNTAKNLLEIEKNHQRHLINNEIQYLEKDLINRFKDLDQNFQNFLDSFLHNPELALLNRQIATLEELIQKFDKHAFKELEKKYRAGLEQQRFFERQKIAKKMQKERIMQFAEIKIQYKKLNEQINNLPLFDLDSLKIQEANLSIRKNDFNLRLQDLRIGYEKIAHEVGKLEQISDHIDKLCHEKKLVNEKMALDANDLRDYKNIFQMLGKDGLQALLIEEAIPELEFEANQLLARLTDNQCHIIIDSLKDLKKGGTKETLDIKISDSVGIRPYEMFSGGEAFRIDFSLRIALSKLLARRAGTSLQTLIIDEGFGSQDDDGLNNIMDCLHRIQDDFAKIIIVSHLPGMKEQFPVHFMVEKGPSGSSVRILEQG
jgi:exonuclease SbcC